MNDSTLTQTICALLGAIPGWKWGAGYTASDVGIYYGAIKATPDRAVGVRVYAAEDDHVTGFAIRRVQVRFRGAKNAPDGADALAEAAFRVLHTLSRTGGISGIRRLSMAPLGADTNGREERSDNYLVTLENPEAS